MPGQFVGVRYPPDPISDSAASVSGSREGMSSFTSWQPYPDGMGACIATVVAPAMQLKSTTSEGPAKAAAFPGPSPTNDSVVYFLPVMHVIANAGSMGNSATLKPAEVRNLRQPPPQ